MSVNRMRLAELALAARSIAERACEGRALEVNERAVDPCARLLDEAQRRVAEGSNDHRSRVVQQAGAAVNAGLASRFALTREVV